MPAAFLLVRENATVTVCHSRTRDLARHVKDAEIVVVAAGQPGPHHGADAPSRRGRRRRRDQRRRRADRRRRRLRVGPPGRVRDHAGAGRRRAADECAPARPSRPGRPRPGSDVEPAADPRRASAAIRPPARPRSARRQPRSSMSFPSDLEIARSVTPRPIMDVAHDLGPARRRDRAVRPHEGQGHARGDRAARGRAAARQVRRRHRDQPDAARRGQVDDDRRARPGAQQDRPDRRRSASASRRSGRCSGSRAERPAAATARSSRWPTSTST